jgi:PAS domain S-box-containing protein
MADLMNLTYAALLVWELEGGIRYWNRGAEELYGFSRAEAVGRVSHDLLRSELPGGLPSFLETLARSGRWDGELRHVTKDGRPIVVDSRNRLVHRDGRRLVLETNRDITERRQAVDRLAHLQAVTAGLGRALMPAQAARVIIEQAVPVVGAFAAFVSVLSPDRRAVEILGFSGVADALVQRWKLVKLEPPVPVTDAIRTGRSLYFESWTAVREQYPFFDDAQADVPPAARAVLPLTVGADTIGALTLMFADRHDFAADERAFLVIVQDVLSGRPARDDIAVLTVRLDSGIGR